ncbi:hypothetical protein DLREEDagrD3_02720 [Denitratisoma sp. agr-D3]
MNPVTSAASSSDDLEKLKWVTHAFANSHNGILITDAQGVVLDVNPALSKITGYSRDEVIGKTPKLFRSGLHDDSFYAELWQGLKQQGCWQGEITNRRKDGSFFVELLAIHAIFAEDGQPAYYIGNFFDLGNLQPSRQLPGTAFHHDLLTQLPGKPLLLDRIRQSLAWLQRQGTLAALCLLDINDFDQMNQRHGHGLGDAVLVEIADRLRCAVREGDTVARLEGNTFAVLIADIDSEEEIELVVNRMTMVLAVPLEQLDGYRLSASIGLAIYPLDSQSPQQLLGNAQRALQTAKQLSPKHPGKSCRYIFDADDAACADDAEESLPLLREALNSGEFQLHYQPIVNLQQGRIESFEASIRWCHPDRGLLGAKESLSLLPYRMEHGALAVEFDLWAIKSALEQVIAWEKRGIVYPVHVNVSLHLLHWSGFEASLAELMAQYPTKSPLSLELRIDDNAPLSDLALTSRVIEACRKLGMAVILDNFGRGYASLTYLKYLPAQVLKIDTSLVHGMLTDAGDKAMVESILGLARAFRRRVIAEGVGTEEQIRVLTDLGCDAAQGHGIGLAMAAADIPAWLAGYRQAAVGQAT